MPLYSVKQIYVNLGYFIQNLLISADYYNFDAVVLYSNEKAMNADTVKIVFSNNRGISIADSKNDSHLIFYISRNQNHAEEYLRKMLERRFSDWIKFLGTPNLRIDITESYDTKDRIADVIIEAMEETILKSEFKKETAYYIKENGVPAPSGFPLFGIGLSDSASFFTPIIAKFINIRKINRKRNEELFKLHTPAFILISVKSDTPENWIKTGQTYSIIGAEAEKLNMGVSTVACGVDNERYHKKIQAAFMNSFRNQIIFRVGYKKNNIKVS